MPGWAWIPIGIAIALVVAAAVWAMMRTRRTRGLQQRFGPEYERTVESWGDRREAESDLAERERRHEQLDIRPLAPAARERYAERWTTVQAAFVDSPELATQQADELVQAVMRERGYPIDDFEQRAGDISVDHPHVVDHYRTAHTISLANDDGSADTEELRQALVHYRALFDELLGEPAADAPLARDDARTTTPLTRDRL